MKQPYNNSKITGKIKKTLKTAFDPPHPSKKSEFLFSFNYPRTSRLTFIATQIFYIRKRIWLISFLLTAIILLAPAAQATNLTAQEIIYNTSINIRLLATASFLPFLALICIREIARSMSYNMAELEMSCKYSLSHIILARLGILGTFNMVIFSGLFISILRETGYGALLLVFQMFAPYILTCAISLFAVNRFRKNEALYISGVVSCLVSLLCFIFYSTRLIYLTEGNIMVAGLFAAIIWMVAEGCKLIKRLEEREWNLSLTD